MAPALGHPYKPLGHVEVLHVQIVAWILLQQHCCRACVEPVDMFMYTCAVLQYYCSAVHWWLCQSSRLQIGRLQWQVLVRTWGLQAVGLQARSCSWGLLVSIGRGRCCQDEGSARSNSCRVLPAGTAAQCTVCGQAGRCMPLACGCRGTGGRLSVLVGLLGAAGCAHASVVSSRHGP